MNEHSLHSEVKTKYSLPGDQFEAKLDNYIADILRGDLVIEVQTKNFSALKEKLQVLIQKHKVRLVYPMPERKWITYVTEDNVTLRKRKSPRKGRLSDVFRELVMISNLIGKENFSFEVLFIDEEEIRCADGKGSWKRRGVSVKERRLLKVNKRVLFRDKADYLKVLPDNLREDFTNNDLAKSAGFSLRTARQITYCLRKCGALQIVEKKGRAFVFQRLAGS
jgi:hypothetical protein